MNLIGLVGPFGSGCTTQVLPIIRERGYVEYSLSKKLKELYALQEPHTDATRPILQDFGDKIRENHGADFLAQLVINDIENDRPTHCVIDSIRNPAEAACFREKFPHFFLFGVFADADMRWERVKEIYANNRGAFETDDLRDSGRDQKDTGQQVTETFRHADIIVHNNDVIREGNDADKKLRLKINTHIDCIEKITKYEPTHIETCMVISYAASMRSSCMKRKVGAAITDKNGNFVSIGFNDVPSAQKPCLSEHGKCYRDYLKEQFRKKIEREISDKDHVSAAYNIFKASFKVLDYCRALHAEESAILNMIQTGASNALPGGIIYTTTYPCTLCANKIAQLGFQKVVYYEPYPMAEAKDILRKKDVVQEAFEGVTYNGYFRLMEVE